jgi:hypothetical protein
MYVILRKAMDLPVLRIGPPYVYVNINPVIFSIGPLAVRWYGLMYMVGIIIGLYAIRGYTARKGISEGLVYRLLWRCIAAGLIGVRLYFVIQQPDLVQHYLLQPATTQFLIFFTRANIYVDFLGTTAPASAQWTSLIVFILLIPLAFLTMRWQFARPVPEGETAITYGIVQQSGDKAVSIVKMQERERKNEQPAEVSETAHQDEKEAIGENDLNP